MDPLSLVVTPLVEKVINSASALVTKEIIKITGLNDQINNLSTILKQIQTVLNDAEKKQLVNPGLKSWLENLGVAANDAEDILDLFATKAHQWNCKQRVRKLKRITPDCIINPWFRSKAARAIEELLKRLDEIDKQKEKFNLVHVEAERPGIRDRRHTGHSVHESEVVGRENDKNEIVDALLTESSGSSNFDVIPIIGMGGLGKTTLAQLVFKDTRIDDHFKMWVCVTENFDLKRILSEMLRFNPESMNNNLEALSISHLESQLEGFLRDKRFLLVLDDVWTENVTDWNSLTQPLRHGARGSKVLVTSRSTKVATMMATGPKPHLLGVLSGEETWKLFSKIAFAQDRPIPEGLEIIGREIITKCNGLPLAVKALAASLHGTDDKDKWRRISENEIWVLERNSETDDLKVLPALKLSYDQLPSNLKQCFLFCSVFPKGHPYRKSQLVKIWIAEGFVRLNANENMRVEVKGNDYFDELLFRSFFLSSNDDSKEKYRMHDLIHDLALSIAGPNFLQVKEETFSEQIRDSPRVNNTLQLENTRHVSLLCENVEQDIEYLIEKSKKLRTILLPGDNFRNFGQVLDKMFRNLKYMRVLDLSSSTIDALPSSIKYLLLLRYLDLSKTRIRMLPNSICKLCNLQTLRLQGCPLLLHELPKDFAMLTELQHLEMDDMIWRELQKLPAGIGSLKNLHNMQKFWVGNEKGHEVVQLKDMTRLTGRLHRLKLENAVNAKEAKLKEKMNLNDVVFEWSEKDATTPSDEERQEGTLEDLQPHSDVESLHIRHFIGREFPTWFKDGLLQKLTSVFLDHCTNCKILSIGQLPNLKSLRLKGMHELEELPDSAWPNLETLRISDCSKLRSLPKVFSNLWDLRINKCDSLETLPFTPSLKFLGLQDWKADVEDPSWINLVAVEIVRCPQLTRLPIFSSPEKLEISDCGLLREPPPSTCKHLKYLTLDTCNDGRLLSVIPYASSLELLDISNISMLLSLPRWPSLPGLKDLYIKGCSDLEKLCEGEDNLHSLTSLRMLSIKNCPKLSELPSSGLPVTLELLRIRSCAGLKSLGPDEMLKGLTSLRYLSIEECQSLQSLPADGFPNSLKFLTIERCPLISERCQAENGGGPDWPKIMNIPYLAIDHDILTTPSDSAVQGEASSSTTRFSIFGCFQK